MATEIQGTSEDFNLLNLPLEILEKTFSYLKYEQIGESRLVCKMFDKVCQQCLNQGFSAAERLHGQIYKEIKAKLPRRESERRSHPLARHMDLLAALETRLSLLAMTYIKYMEMGMCCFIPGKVLDEIYDILYQIRNDPTPPRPHELLTELRDISSMAMEHFEEKIVPVVKERIRQRDAELRSNTDLSSGNNDSTHDTAESGYQLSVSTGTSHPVMNSRVPPLRMEIVQLRNSLRSTSSTVVSLRKEVNDFKAIVSDQHRKMLEQDKKIIGLNRTVVTLQKKSIEQEKLFINMQNMLIKLQGQMQGANSTLLEDELVCVEGVSKSQKDIGDSGECSNKHGYSSGNHSASPERPQNEADEDDDVNDDDVNVDDEGSSSDSSVDSYHGYEGIDELDERELMQRVCGELKRKLDGDIQDASGSKRVRGSPSSAYRNGTRSEGFDKHKYVKILNSLDVSDSK